MMLTTAEGGRATERQWNEGTDQLPLLLISCQRLGDWKQLAITRETLLSIWLSLVSGTSPQHHDTHGNARRRKECP